MREAGARGQRLLDVFEQLPDPQGRAGGDCERVRVHREQVLAFDRRNRVDLVEHEQARDVGVAQRAEDALHGEHLLSVTGMRAVDDVQDLMMEADTQQLSG